MTSLSKTMILRINVSSLVMNLYNRQKFISSDYKNTWPTFVFAKLLCVQQSNDITMRSKRIITCLKYRSTFQTISSLLPQYIIIIPYYSQDFYL